MPGGIRVDLETLGRVGVIRRFQQPGAQRQGLLMGDLHVIDEEVEVDLLRRSIGPLGRDMSRRELESQPGNANDVRADDLFIGGRWLAPLPASAEAA
jgi:hypothetical protein